MKSVIIIDSFHARTETFIGRHIAGLQSDVVAVNTDGTNLEGMDWKPIISFLRTGNQQGEDLLGRVLRRIRQVLTGLYVQKWPRGMERVFERYIKERRPTVALAEFAPNGIVATNACQRYGIPLVVHFHGYDASSLLRFKNYRRILPSLFEQSAAIVVVSQFMRNTLERLGCPLSKIYVIPCGAPVEEFPISDTIEKQPCRFLTVASFTPMKGSLYTLKGFAKCIEQCPDVTLTMIGDGKEYGKAIKWVQRHNLSQKVHMMGFQPIKVVSEHMAKSGVFLQHSVTSQVGHVEGWGVSIAEAAASGLPVIATRHGGIPDQVIDGETGFLVEERDWEAMAEKMIFLANNPGKRKEMGLAGRRNIEEVGDTKKQIDKLREVLLAAAEMRKK